MTNLWLCDVLDIHKWEKWSPPAPTTWKERYEKWGVPMGEWEPRTGYEQERTCTRCGKFERRLNSI